MLSLLRSESRRNLISKQLDQLNAGEQEARLHAMLEESTSKKEKALAKVQKLESENKELKDAFEMFAAESNEHDVDKIVLNFTSRGANQVKLEGTRDTAVARLQKVNKNQEQLLADLKKAKIDLHAAEENSLTSTKSRKRRDELTRVLQPKTRSRDRQKTEMENRVLQLKSIQRVLVNINTLDGVSSSKCVPAAPQQEQVVQKADNFQFPNSPSQKKSTRRKSLGKKRTNSKGRAKSREKGKAKRRYTGKVLPIGKVIDTVAAIFENKVRADKVDDTSGNPRDSLEEFAYLFFSQQYGSILQKKKMEEFRGSLETHLQQFMIPDPSNVHELEGLQSVGTRLKWFSILIGWSAETTTYRGRVLHSPYHPLAIDAYLQVLSELIPMNSIEERLDELSGLQVDVNGVLKALGADGDGIFDQKYRQTPPFRALVTEIRTMGNSESKSASSLVDFDAAMDVVLSAWYRWQVTQPAGDPASAAGRGGKDANKDEAVVKKKTWLEQNNIDELNLHELSKNAKGIISMLVTALNTNGSTKLFGAALYQEIEKGDIFYQAKGVNGEAASDQEVVAAFSGAGSRPQTSESGLSTGTGMSMLSFSALGSRPPSGSPSRGSNSRQSHRRTLMNLSTNVSRADMSRLSIRSRISKLNPESDSDADSQGSSENEDIELDSDSEIEAKRKKKAEITPLTRDEMKMISLGVQHGKIRHQSHLRQTSKSTYESLRDKVAKKVEGEDGASEFRRGSIVERMNAKRMQDRNRKLQALVLDINVDDMMPSPKARRQSRYDLSQVTAPSALRPNSQQPSRQATNPRVRRMKRKTRLRS
jgi:hypothetical protein